MKIIVTGPDEEARENFEADQPVFVIMVNGDLCQFESQSTVGQAVQDLVDEEVGPRPQIGSQVKKADGDVGTVTAYDRAAAQWQVKWASGDEGWYPRDELEVC